MREKCVNSSEDSKTIAGCVIGMALAFEMAFEVGSQWEYGNKPEMEARDYKGIE